MTTVLIVDDSQAIRNVTSCMLMTLGVDTALAENGQDALEICQQSMPDAILLDWNMPVMNGIEFQQKLRELPQGQRPKIIFCTIENDFAKIAQAVSGGADAFIIKPFSIKTLSYNLKRLGIIETADDNKPAYPVAS